MKPPSAFDRYAASYDAEFTDSRIGRLQRGQVWRWLQPHLKMGHSVLEVNCGTGVDAIRMARAGCKVTATDLSPAMIERAREKLSRQEEERQVHLREAGFLELANTFPEHKFNLVFSNFGGLNCIGPEDQRKVARQFAQMVDEKGCLFLVYISQGCFWERLYYYLKRNPREARRRTTTGPLPVNVKGQAVKVWYYRPSDIARYFAPHWKVARTRPVGLWVPPSYLEAAFRKWPKILNLLQKLDRWFATAGFLANYADHFAVVLRRR